MSNKQQTIRSVAIIAGVVVVALIIILVGRPRQGNQPDDNFKAVVERQMTEEVREELTLRISVLEASIEGKGENKDIDDLLKIGNLYDTAGELAKSKAQYEAIIRRNPTDVAARENMGTTLVEMGDYLGAERVWAEALAISGSKVTVLRLVNLIDEHIPEHHDRIGPVLEEAILSIGQETGLLVALADWYFDVGNYERAYDHYQLAKQISGSDDYDDRIAESRVKWVEGLNGE